MVKKVLFGMLAFASLFATSCTNELEQVEAGNASSVSFKVMTPAMESRAYSDGSTATVLQYAVYDAEGKILPALTKTDGTINGSTTVNLQLTTGNTYSVIFWAGAEDAPYDVDFDNKKMTVDYTTAAKTKSNDENRDAFYKYHTFTVNGAQTETIELKRPFAQLNIGTADYTASANAGYTPTQSAVTVKNIYKTLDLEGGIVSDEQEVSFASAAIPAKYNETENTGEKFPVDGYDYLAMNYLLVGADQETIEVEYTYTDGSDAKTRTVGSVPVRRNYRTNIYGNLLTSEVDVKVEINPDYDGNLELDELHKAALNGGTVTLTEDVVLTTPLEVYGKLVIDLNGHTITNAAGYAIENYSTLTINGNSGGISGLGGIRSHAGQITINGGTYTGSSKWNDTPATYQHILKAVKTEVVINGGVFDATIMGTNNAMINVSTGSKVTINGGEFRNVAENTTIPTYPDYMFTYEEDGKLIINDGKFHGGWRFNGKTATTDIYGGNFTVSYDGQSFNANSTHVLTIYGGTFNKANGAKLNPTNFVSVGNNILETDNIYYVLPEAIADAATNAGVTTVTDKYQDIALALDDNNNAVTLYVHNGVAYIAKYGHIEMYASPEGAITGQYIVSNESKNTDWPLKSAVVAEGIEVVGNRTFKACFNMESVVLPSTLKEIGPGVFQSCSSLTSVNIPAGVTAIGEGAFTECTGLKTINIPTGVTRIEKDALRATGLETIEFHEGVTYFGVYAFRDCKQLTKVVINAPEFTMENNTFGIMAAPFTPMTIEVANAQMKTYVESKLTDHAKTYITVVAPEIVDSSEELANNAAEGKNVVLGNDLTDVAVNTTAPYGNKYGIAHNGGVIDGNNYVLDFDSPSGDNYGIMTSGGTIKNITIGGVFRGIMIMNPTQDIVIDNAIIGDEDVCYPINTGEGDGTHSLYVSNTTIKGWNSYGTAIKDVTFKNCTFAQGEYYTNVYGRLTKPYVNAVYENCEFSSLYYIDLSQFGKDGDGNVLDDTVKLVLKNCTVNGVKLTKDNWTSLIVAEDECGEGQISIELKDGSYLSANNLPDYVVIE